MIISLTIEFNGEGEPSRWQLLQAFSDAGKVAGNALYNNGTPDVDESHDLADDLTPVYISEITLFRSE